MTTTIFLSTAGEQDRPIADALVAALTRFGRRGSVRVLRDGDPASADWFLLLASPDSATDGAVVAAVEQRLAAVGVERLQVVVTAGTWVWDSHDQRVHASSTAVPAPLREAFPVEPRHMVYRGQRGVRPASRDPLFLQQVAEIVAPVLGTTKDDLTGEDVRRQRRTRTLTRIAAASLAGLLVLAGAGGILAVQGAAAADRARAHAETERDRADSRRLAALASQVANSDGALARLLAVEAWHIAETDQARAALDLAADVSGGWEVTTVADDVRRLIGHTSHPVDLELSNTRAASIDTSSVLRIWDLEETSSAIEVDSVFGLADLAWSHDGSTLAAAGGRVHLFDQEAEPLGFAGQRGVAHLVGPWGASGFVAGGDSVALTEGRSVVAERTVAELGIDARLAFAAGSEDAERILVASEAGEVALLDPELDVIERWQFSVAVDQFGERDSMSVLAWDGADGVMLPPDNESVLGPIMGTDGAPTAQDGAIAGVYDALTGEAIAPVLSTAYLPLPATSGTFLPDGSAIALTPGGLESPPTFGGTEDAPDLSAVPLPNGADTVRVSPDGSWLAVTGADPEANLTQLAGEPEDSGDPVARACSAAGRNLTEAEWAIYLPDREYRATCEGFATE